MFETKIILIQKFCHETSKIKDNSHYVVLKARVLEKLYTNYLALFYSSYIPVGAKLKGAIRFNHSFYNIFISEHAEIGLNCTILQNTTIGSNQPLNNKAPKIGDNVFIGANCNIIGDVEIGDNCIIGAGTTIANSKIPSNSIIVGQKYRVIKRSDDDE